MNERERLGKMLCNVFCYGDDRREVGCPERSHNKCSSIEKLEMCQIHNIADHLLANGVIVPPCNVGDVVYYTHVGVDRVYEGEVTGFVYVSNNNSFGIHYDGGYGVFGRYVFLTREEAEAEIAVRKEQG